MKIFLIPILLLLSFFCKSQDTQQKYHFKYVYYIITNNETKEKREIPTGKDADVIYDTFFKSYKTVWTDNENIRAGTSFIYLKNEGEMDLVRDDTKTQYLVWNLMTAKDKLFIIFKEPRDNHMVMILFTNQIL
ncbi:hypothetical protein [Chryseobacterium sp.]|uniref:hypothetical protein n=1 Tax=Chryseobacterium sp. TaxID=1871047 RepID=UPI00388DD44A